MPAAARRQRAHAAEPTRCLPHTPATHRYRNAMRKSTRVRVANDSAVVVRLSSGSTASSGCGSAAAPTSPSQLMLHVCCASASASAITRVNSRHKSAASCCLREQRAQRGAWGPGGCGHSGAHRPAPYSRRAARPRSGPALPLTCRCLPAADPVPACLPPGAPTPPAPGAPVRSSSPGGAPASRAPGGVWRDGWARALSGRSGCSTPHGSTARPLHTRCTHTHHQPKVEVAEAAVGAAQQQVAAVRVAVHHASDQQLRAAGAGAGTGAWPPLRPGSGRMGSHVHRAARCLHIPSPCPHLRQRALHAHAHEAQHAAARGAPPLPLLLARVRPQRHLCLCQQLRGAGPVHPFGDQHPPRRVAPHRGGHCRGWSSGWVREVRRGHAGVWGRRGRAEKIWIQPAPAERAPPVTAH